MDPMLACCIPSMPSALECAVTCAMQHTRLSSPSCTPTSLHMGAVACWSLASLFYMLLISESSETQRPASYLANDFPVQLVDHRW